jgi:protein-disulfide isomerase
MHIHWGEEHGDELNSHQREKVKKASRKQNEEKTVKMQKRKQLAGYGFVGVLGLAVIGFLAMQIVNNPSFGQPQSTSFQLEQQPMLGSSDAPVTVVEFGDYRCPFCRQFETAVFPQLKENYIDTGQVKFYVNNYAFLGPGSTQAAVAGECVNQQDEEQFWEFHRAVYANQGPESEQWVTTDFLMQIARDNTEGLDYEELNSCITSQRTLDQVQQDVQIANQNQVSGTPTVYVNGQKVNNWQYNGLRAAVERELR